MVPLPLKKDLPLHSLRQVILTTIESHLSQAEPYALYEQIVGDIEEAMLSAIMAHVRHNQLKAAKLLGISRGNLRTKLKKYYLL